MSGVGVGLGVSVALLYRSHTALNRECRAVSYGFFILFIIKMGGDIKGTISRPFFWRLYCTVVYCFLFDGDTRLDVFVYT